MSWDLIRKNLNENKKLLFKVQNQQDKIRLQQIEMKNTIEEIDKIQNKIKFLLKQNSQSNEETK